MVCRVFAKGNLAAAIAIFLILLGSLLTSVPANAQVTGATLTGTVSDPSGSIITGAEVNIRNLGTGIIRTVTTDSAGLYSAPNLIPGNYEVAVTSTGFSKAVESNLTLSVGQQQTFNVSLKVGESTQTVTVQADALQVQTETSEVSTLISGEQVRQLAKPGRPHGVRPPALSAAARALDAERIVWSNSLLRVRWSSEA